MSNSLESNHLYYDLVCQNTSDNDQNLVFKDKRNTSFLTTTNSTKFTICRFHMPTRLPIWIPEIDSSAEVQQPDAETTSDYYIYDTIYKVGFFYGGSAYTEPLQYRILATANTTVSDVGGSSFYVYHIDEFVRMFNRALVTAWVNFRIGASTATSAIEEAATCCPYLEYDNDTGKFAFYCNAINYFSVVVNTELKNLINTFNFQETTNSDYFQFVTNPLSITTSYPSTITDLYNATLTTNVTTVDDTDTATETITTQKILSFDGISSTSTTTTVSSLSVDTTYNTYGVYSAASASGTQYLSITADTSTVVYYVTGVNARLSDLSSLDIDSYVQLSNAYYVYFVVYDKNRNILYQNGGTSSMIIFTSSAMLSSASYIEFYTIAGVKSGVVSATSSGIGTGSPDLVLTSTTAPAIVSVISLLYFAGWTSSAIDSTYTTVVLEAGYNDLYYTVESADGTWSSQSTVTKQGGTASVDLSTTNQVTLILQDSSAGDITTVSEDLNSVTTPTSSTNTTSSSTTYTVTPASPFYVYTQQIQCLQNFNPVHAIVLTTNNLAVKESLTNSDTSMSGTNPSVQTEYVISDFVLSLAADNMYNPDILYEPSSEYRWFDIGSDSKQFMIEINAFWRNSSNELIPITISKYQTATIKLLFCY